MRTCGLWWIWTNVQAFRARALNPEKPVLRGSAENQ